MCVYARPQFIFTSPDGKEVYILYHGNAKPGQGCGGFRSPRAQQFTWNKDSSPNFGVPAKEGEILKVLSGSRKLIYKNEKRSCKILKNGKKRAG